MVKKLGIKEGCAIYSSGAPPQYRALLKPLPVGVKFKATLDSSINIAHVFETDKDRLAKVLVARKKLR